MEKWKAEQLVVDLPWHGFYPSFSGEHPALDWDDEERVRDAERWLVAFSRHEYFAAEDLLEEFISGQKE